MYSPGVRSINNTTHFAFTRKEMLDELSVKTMRLIETEDRLNSIQAYMSNSNQGIKVCNFNI